MTIPPQLNKRQSQPLSLRKESPNTMLPPPSKILHRKESAICNNTASTSLLLPGKDTSSSAGKVFARPSKEWVLPERAKPGRKLSVESPDNVSTTHFISSSVHYHPHFVSSSHQLYSHHHFPNSAPPKPYIGLIRPTHQTIISISHFTIFLYIDNRKTGPPISKSDFSKSPSSQEDGLCSNPRRQDKSI